MRTIHFATTNKGKLKEAREILGIDVIGTPLKIDEVQSLDPVEVATKKARAYYAKLKKPIMVDDISLSFNALGNLPGTYINDFSKVMGNEGLVGLLKDKKDRTAVAQLTVVFMDRSGKDHLFVGLIKGTISKKVVGDRGFGWDPIFIPKGHKKTFAQMSAEEKNEISMRAIALKKFKKWLDSQ